MELTNLPNKLMAPAISELFNRPLKPTISFNNPRPPAPANPQAKLTDAYLNYLRKNGRLEEAITALDSAGQSLSKLRPKTLSGLIRSCIASNSVSLSRELHRYIDLVKTVDPYFETNLVEMYAKCGYLEDARRVFDEMPQRDLYTWSAMIGACSREEKWEEVMELFFLMMEEGVIPDAFLFPKVVQACANCKDIKTGKSIHSIVLKSGISKEISVQNSILAVYTKCGRLNSARKYFEKMVEKDTVSWNLVITGYGQKGDIEEAQKLFELMQGQGFKPDLVTWNIILSTCNQLGRYDFAYLNYLHENGPTEAITALDSTGKSLSKVRPKILARLIHSCIDLNSITFGRELHRYMDLVNTVNPFFGTKLVGMYAKCGSIEEARSLFNKMPERNLYTWSAMIGACSREGRWDEVMELFFLMMEEGVIPDAFLFPKVLQACGNCKDIKTGKLIHSIILKSRLGKKIRVQNSILAVYAKCGKLNSAKKFFEKMVEKDTVSWNAIITGYGRKGKIKEARKLFDSMLEQGIKPDLVTWNILLSAYNQLGRCDFATELMKEMEIYGLAPDVCTWTSMVSGFAKNKRLTQALDLFKDMVLTGINPNGFTLISAMSACASLKTLKKGKELHSLAVKTGLVRDMLVLNSLVDMYSKCNDLKSAQRVFDSIVEKDVYAWNSMIGGYFQAGYCGKAHDLFTKMRKSNFSPNVVTLNVMITGYMLNGDEDEAIDLFQDMGKNGLVNPDTSSWNSMICGFLENGQKEKALGMFRQMQSLSFEPNSITILSVLPACANLISAKRVKEIHCCVTRRCLDFDLSVSNSLIDTYAKSGNLPYSRALFNRILVKDIITWNTLIAGCLLHGFPNEAIALFSRMIEEGIKPSRVTLVSVISAYGKAKLVKEGEQIFYTMSEEYHIQPNLDHYAAMVNLYGRWGKLEKALKLIENLEMEPDSSVLAAFLTACRINGNFRLAIETGEQLLDVDPGNLLIQRQILQIYEICGLSDDSMKVKKYGKSHESLEFLGWSWIEIQNRVYAFINGDENRSNSDLLHSGVKNMKRKMKGFGYCDDGVWIEEEEREEICGVHSEKLAIAFALINSHQTRPCVRIVKNLRMCRDCHRMAKFVSKFFECEIYLNDPNCLHHFRNGRCSCGDYW